ncbi:MAG: SDR family NAD(P)-dependent oxidoreductase [Lysobacterales bacterium]|jgi:NAD(P)-dependent dehydrogenase (short-subunit alcohol dehydrogenase family)
MRANKTIILTGAAGSLGSTLARACAANQWNVVLVDVNQRALERVYDEIVEQGALEPILHPLDLATAGTEQFETMVAAVASEFGGLDALVHCAARFEALMPSDHIAPPEWLLSLQVNLNAAWLLSVTCLDLLRKSERGRLYFLLDNLERVGSAFWGPYGVSKHALRSLVGQLSVELKKTSVQVLGINPGPFQSPLRSRAYVAEKFSDQPPPAAAADRIMNYLEGRAEPSGCFVDFERDSASA